MVSLRQAVVVLRSRFGSEVAAPRLPGKTLFRDALCEECGVSQLDAELLCDSLEGVGAVRFQASPEHGWIGVIDPSAVPDDEG